MKQVKHKNVFIYYTKYKSFSLTQTKLVFYFHDFSFEPFFF